MTNIDWTSLPRQSLPSGEHPKTWPSWGRTRADGREVLLESLRQFYIYAGDLLGGMHHPKDKVAVFIGLPVIGPPVAAAISSIGSSIGGLFGLSGIAATNAGLALIGGGSIASGGFGVIGGTSLLAAALTFGTEVTMDYGIGSVVTQFDSAKFSEASLKMMTLAEETIATLTNRNAELLCLVMVGGHVFA